jgi:protocatechuate 3,4-dioxygenase beta subunit
MITNITRRQLLGAGVSAVGAGLVLAGCAGDSESASTSAPGTTSDGGDAGTTPTAPVTTNADTAPATVDEVAPSTDAPAAADTSTTANTSATSESPDRSTLTNGTPSTTVFTPADFAGLGTCLLFPDLTAGPFPSIELMERRDITEGMTGHPLRVGIQVVDESCAPIPGALVEIWHCDVDGDYSAYQDGATDDDAGEGTTFYRGYQTSNTDGVVEFLTSYPGWYRGRAVHIHSQIHIDEATALTTQFLFDDELNDEIMAQGVYAAYGSPDTTNAEDGVTRGISDASAVIMTASADVEIAGTRALIVVGVDPNAR